MLSSSAKATCIGLTAIIVWSFSFGFARLAAEGLGSCLGPAINYFFAALSMLVYGMYKGKKESLTENSPYQPLKQAVIFLRTVPLSYILIGGGLFVSNSIVTMLAIAFSTSSRQVLEVGLINYIWPSLIIIFSVLFFKEKLSKLVYLGVGIAFFGIIYSTSGGHFDIGIFIANLQTSPLPYALGFYAALSWATYSIIIRYWKSYNCLALFFAFISAFFWIAAFKLGQVAEFSFTHFPYIAFISAFLLGVFNALSYGTWEIGIGKGNVMILVVASYFIPILSSLFTTLCLLELPDSSFWVSVVLVVTGSLISWYATQKR